MDYTTSGETDSKFAWIPVVCPSTRKWFWLCFVKIKWTATIDPGVSYTEDNQIVFPCVVTPTLTVVKVRT